MDALGLYFDQSVFDFVVSFLGFLPVGVILGVFAWVISYFVGKCMRLFRTRL